MSVGPPVCGGLSLRPQETSGKGHCFPQEGSGRGGLVRPACGPRGGGAQAHTQLSRLQPRPLLVSPRPATEGPGTRTPPRGRVSRTRGLGRPDATKIPRHPPTLDSKPRAKGAPHSSGGRLSPPPSALPGCGGSQPGHPSPGSPASTKRSGCGRGGPAGGGGEPRAYPRTPSPGRAELYYFLIKARPALRSRLRGGWLLPKAWGEAGGGNESKRRSRTPASGEKGRNQRHGCCSPGARRQTIHTETASQPLRQTPSLGHL